MTKKPKYTSIFSSTIRPVVSEEKDKYLAVASLEQLRRYIPEISEDGIDLLPVAFNACVANRVNKNDDVVDTKTAKAIGKNFINKFINIEHNRQNIVGFIVSYAFTKFGSDEAIKEEDLKDEYNEPFNITLGGFIWKLASSNLIERIEDCNDPTSENYLKISASWELGFQEYEVVVLPEGKKNLEDGVVYSSDADVASYQDKLRLFGGKGTTVDDKRVYRKPRGKVVSFGIGLTERPAADVEGIATKLAATASASKIEENISQNQNLAVKTTEKEKVTPKPKMKIKNISDITENWEQLSASAVTEFIAQHIKTSNEEYVSKLDKEKQASDAALSAKAELEKQAGELNEKIAALQKKVDEFSNAEAARVKVETFNVRMEKVAQAFELTDEVREIVVSQIKGIDTDEAFAAWEKQAEVLLKGYSKAEKARLDKEAKDAADAAFPFKKKGDKEEDDEEEGEEGDKKKKKGEKHDCKASAKEVVEGAVENGEKEKTVVINTQASEQTLEDKFAKFFTKDGFNIRYNTKL